jgi:hypothetical protein
MGVEIATLFGCFAVGTIASVAAERLHLPFSALAFAADTAVDPMLASTTLALSFKSVFVIGAIAIGLLIGARLANLAYRRG